jgi:ATP-dependent DNA helicase DinG
VRRLGATPLEAGPRLRSFWQASDLAPVMTSATLAIGEDFTHMLGELGLTRRQPATATYLSASPFDYHRQTLALAPARFPAPGARDFGRAVGEVLRDLARHVPRKILGLFTSYQAIGEAAEVLAEAGWFCDDLTGDLPEDVDAGAVRVLVQSPRGEAGALLEQFRLSSRALLLGTNTFWEGVDFPGGDLEILVVSKLPFLVPNDPWVEARCERISAAGENPFTTFMVRDAVLRLRQGLGRLIRRTSDRGVFLLLDNRLHTKNYGVTFLNALPVLPVAFQGRDDLRERVQAFFTSTGDSTS